MPSCCVEAECELAASEITVHNIARISFPATLQVDDYERVLLGRLVRRTMVGL
jgi:hypothetical protein